MSLVAIHNNRRLVAPFLSDSDWREVQRMCAQGNVILPESKHLAAVNQAFIDGKTYRYFIPAGRTEEAPSLELVMNIEVIKRLMSLNIQVQVDYAIDNWRGPIIINRPDQGQFLVVMCIDGASTDIDRDIERSAMQHARSGYDTLWLVRGNGRNHPWSQQRKESTPLFFIDESTPARYSATASQLILDFLEGRYSFVSPEQFRNTRAKPIAARVKCSCGKEWLHPVGLVLGLDEIAPGFKPEFISATKLFTSARMPVNEADLLEKSHFETCASAFTSIADQLGLPLGHIDDRLLDEHKGGGKNSHVTHLNTRPIRTRAYCCPSCHGYVGHIGDFGIPKETLCRTPAKDICEIDATPYLDDKMLKPQWVRASTQLGEDGHTPMTIREWKQQVITPISQLLQSKMKGITELF